MAAWLPGGSIMAPVRTQYPAENELFCLTGRSIFFESETTVWSFPHHPMARIPESGEEGRLLSMSSQTDNSESFAFCSRDTELSCFVVAVDVVCLFWPFDLFHPLLPPPAPASGNHPSPYL